jgi:hypothetical protein
MQPEWRANATALQERNARLQKHIPAPYTLRSSGGFLTAGRRDIVAAMDLALHGVIAKEPGQQRASTQKAREILLAWAKDTVFPGQFFMERPSKRQDLADYAGLGLYVGQIAIGAVHVYQLVGCTEGLRDSDDAIVKAWFRRLVDAIMEGRKRWEDNNYFSGQRGNNHLSTHNAAIYALGVALGDRRLRAWALRSPENKSNFMIMLDLAIYNGRELAQVGHDKPGSVPARGEIYDRYRMAEEKKGLNYAFVHLLQLTILAEAAENNGEEVYRAQGRNGETLRDAFKFYGELLAAVQCSTEKVPVVSAQLAGFDYYRGAKVEPLFWVWILPLMARFSDHPTTTDLATKIRSKACDRPVSQYSPVPFNVFTN